MKSKNVMSLIVGAALALASVTSIINPVTVRGANTTAIPVATTLVTLTNGAGVVTNGGIAFPLPAGVALGRPVTFVLTFTPSINSLTGGTNFSALAGFDLISQDGVTRSTYQPLLLSFTNTVVLTNGAYTTWAVVNATNFNGASAAALDFTWCNFTNGLTLAGQLTWNQ